MKLSPRSPRLTVVIAGALALVLAHCNALIDTPDGRVRQEPSNNPGTPEPTVDGCPAGSKTCGAQCVSVDDPSTG